jgi:GDP-4-dehydro-6-deoxy-D-mannose reductase
VSVLVTGGTGALGYHLLSLLTAAKGDLHSFSDEPPYPWQRWNHVQYHTGNLLNYKEILDVMRKSRPTEIYHLASQSSVGMSYLKPYETLSTNLLGTQNLLEAIRQTMPKSKIILLSSAEIYGRGKLNLTTLHTESDPPDPLTPYATSKACMELLGNQFRNAHGTHVMTVRPFHFTGPKHSRRFALPSIAYQLMQIRQTRGEPVIFTGNLDVTRDVVDVRDLARALVLIMNTSDSGETFNICSGLSYTFREMVEQLITLSKLDVEIRLDPSLERINDIPLLLGSAEKLMNFGWKPIICIEDSLADLYNEMDARFKQESSLD